MRCVCVCIYAVQCSQCWCFFSPTAQLMLYAVQCYWFSIISKVLPIRIHCKSMCLARCEFVAWSLLQSSFHVKLLCSVMCFCSRAHLIPLVYPFFCSFVLFNMISIIVHFKSKCIHTVRNCAESVQYEIPFTRSFRWKCFLSIKSNAFTQFDVYKFAWLFFLDLDSFARLIHLAFPRLFNGNVPFFLS